MQNFTGSWARAASQPMPGAVNPMGQPGAGDGTGGGPSIGSLRPKPNPNAGLNEPQVPKVNGMLDAIMRHMLGKSYNVGRPGSQKMAGLSSLPIFGQKQTQGGSAPVRPEDTRAGRASSLFAIGAGLMD